MHENTENSPEVVWIYDKCVNTLFKMIVELFRVHKTKADYHSGTKYIMAPGKITILLTARCMRRKSLPKDVKTHMPNGS